MYFDFEDISQNDTIVCRVNHHSAWWSYGRKKIQTELIVEIYSKSLFRAIGKVLHMHLTTTPYIQNP